MYDILYIYLYTANCLVKHSKTKKYLLVGVLDYVLNGF